MKGVALGLLAILWTASLATAADLSQLYDRPTLQYWGERYTRSTTRILDAVIWPALLRDEKSRLVRKPVLEFPLRAPGEARQHPLAFYALTGRHRIVLPVLSLKLLDDLCTAYAWLQIKGYRL
jgi:hypothetical protein